MLCKLFRTRPLARPTIYLGVCKLLIVLLLSLLWFRFIDGGQRGAGFAMNIFGLVLLLISWFYYLSIDGFSPVQNLFGRRKTKKKKEAVSFDIADFTDEDITQYRDLEPEERTACQLVSGLAAGMAAIVIGLFL